MVVLPRRMATREADRLVIEHADWLDRHLGRIQAEQAQLAQRPALGEGRPLDVAGQRYRVSEVDAGTRRPPRGRVEEAPGRLLVRRGRDGRTAADLLDAWLRERARSAISDVVAHRAAAMAVAPGRVSIRDQSSRWASASANGSLSFSWRLILTPPFVLDAVVVHELAHLRIRGHTRRFWDLVESHAPRTSEARRWLRTHGREVRAALD